MTPVFAVAVKSISTVMVSESEEVEKVTRHIVSIDTMSLLESDEPQPSAEDIATAERTYKEILRTLPTDRERFIAMCLGNGFDQVDVAFMLKVHPSQVSRAIRRIRVTLKSFT